MKKTVPEKICKYEFSDFEASNLMLGTAIYGTTDLNVVAIKNGTGYLFYEFMEQDEFEKLLD